MNEIMTQLYRRGLTVVSNRRGYGLYYTSGDTLQFLELQADNDHCADRLLQAARPLCPPAARPAPRVTPWFWMETARSSGSTTCRKI